jgi:hypothetical protein
VLGRFISADRVVPGRASGELAGVALTPLTVDFHAPGLVAGLNDEARPPFWFQVRSDQRRQRGSPWGPQHPQALNRYSYVQNNPLRYTDPTGHSDCSVVDTSPGGVCTIGGGGGGGEPPGPGGSGQAPATSAKAEAAARGGNEFIDDLPDDEILYQYSRPPKDGQFQGFPKDLRPGESGMSCQIASQCGNDPIQGFRQQFGREPGPGDWVRTTTVGDVKQWGGRVVADGGKPGLPVGHGTIYSTGGKWGKPFARIWRNERPLIE